MIRPTTTGSISPAPHHRPLTISDLAPPVMVGGKNLASNEYVSRLKPRNYLRIVNSWTSHGRVTNDSLKNAFAAARDLATRQPKAKDSVIALQWFLGDAFRLSPALRTVFTRLMSELDPTSVLPKDTLGRPTAPGQPALLG